jgi:pilus assembly protein Flp/PilA
MGNIGLKCRDLIKNDDGATATEYAVMLALIIIVCIVAISLLGNKVNNSFKEMANLMPDN